MLRATVVANRHPAVGMWLVGNEVNLESERFVCEMDGFCMFWDQVEAAFGVRRGESLASPPEGARERDVARCMAGVRTAHA